MTGAMQVLIVATAVLGGLGVYLQIPRGATTSARNAGMGLTAVALLLLWVMWFANFQDCQFLEKPVFCVLASMAVCGAVMTVTRRNPVSCALWFTSVVIGTAGLFLLQNAQFLAAAIVIVYAGAIIVMFLFVVMLAQPAGAAFYDRISREPALAVGAGSVLLAVLLTAIVATYRGESPGLRPEPGAAAVSKISLLENSGDAPQVATLGATLFTDHWLSLEVAGTMLLVAMVGAILIAAQRERS